MQLTGVTFLIVNKDLSLPYFILVLLSYFCNIITIATRVQFC